MLVIESAAEMKEKKHNSPESLPIRTACLYRSTSSSSNPACLIGPPTYVVHNSSALARSESIYLSKSTETA
jgi:hypothetical protein